MSAIENLIDIVEGNASLWREGGAQALRAGDTTEARRMLAKVEQADSLKSDLRGVRDRLRMLLGSDFEADELISHAEKTQRRQDHSNPVVLNRYRRRTVEAINLRYGVHLERKSGITSYTDQTRSFRISLLVSKYMEKKKLYWYGFHPQQKQFLEEGGDSYLVLGMLDQDIAVVLPRELVLETLPNLNVTRDDKRMYWHFHISRDSAGLRLMRARGSDPIPLKKYLIDFPPRDHGR